MVSPLVRWDHSVDWPVMDGRSAARSGASSKQSTVSFTIDPFNAEDPKVSDTCYRRQ